MSDYKITFAPELNLTAADFADSWNSIEQCRELTEAKTETATQNDFTLGEIAMIASLSFVGGLAADVLKDLVKDAIKVVKPAFFETYFGQRAESWA